MAVRGEGGLVVAAGAPSSPPPSSLDDALVAARQRALDLRAELDGIIAAQSADPPDDEHDVEGASVGFERARVTALLVAAESSVSDLEAAAVRRANGVGSACEVCGGPIGDERLSALPATRRCVACAAARSPR